MKHKLETDGYELTDEHGLTVFVHDPATDHCYRVKVPEDMAPEVVTYWTERDAHDVERPASELLREDARRVEHYVEKSSAAGRAIDAGREEMNAW